MSSFRGDSLESVVNDELIERLQALVRKGQRTDAALLAHIGEVDARKLYLEQAFPSMFDYCMRELHMEEGVAYGRIYAARAARQHPALLEALRAGELHLTGIRLIAPWLTAENCSDWICAVRHRSVREIRELLADRQPKPDVEASIRKQRVVPETVEPRLEIQSPTAVRAEASQPAAPSVSAAPLPPVASQASRREPLGGGRYRVTFTADEACHAALGELRSLLRHEIPDGDLAKLLKRAVSELLAKTRKRKFAELAGGRGSKAPKRVESQDVRSAPGELPSHPRESHPPASRHIPHAIRRAVWKRDEGSCSFVSSGGRRCDSRDFLEFDHLEPWARKRHHTTRGIALRCRAHNQAAARAVFGDRHMDRFTRQSARGSHGPGGDAGQALGSFPDAERRRPRRQLVSDHVGLGG